MPSPFSHGCDGIFGDDPNGKDAGMDAKKNGQIKPKGPGFKNPPQHGGKQKARPKLSVGDGVMAVSTARTGVITEIVGQHAVVAWKYGPPERLKLSQLDFCPTPEQIAERGRALQREWSDREEQDRSSYPRVPAAVAPTGPPSHRKYKKDSLE